MEQFKQPQEFSAFRVWYFRDSRNFNYAITGMFTSTVWNFWLRSADVSLCFSYVAAGANERRLYSQAINRVMILFTQHPHYLCYFSLCSVLMALIKDRLEKVTMQET